MTRVSSYAKSRPTTALVVRSAEMRSELLGSFEPAGELPEGLELGGGERSNDSSLIRPVTSPADSSRHRARPTQIGFSSSLLDSSGNIEGVRFLKDHMCRFWGAHPFLIGRMVLCLGGSSARAHLSRVDCRWQGLI